jgi:hypothetical protein
VITRFGDALRKWVHGGKPALVSAREAATQVEADVLAAALGEAGIPVLVHPRGIPGYEGVFERAAGVWADLLVRADDLHRARVLIAKFLESPAEEDTPS